jgi:CRISPR-associated endonuclease/helicase Cas3
MRWTLDTYRECELLAKSKAYGGVSLKNHLIHVGWATEKLAEVEGKDIEICRTAAYLHDIGKAHPKFQGFVHGELSVIDLRNGVPHRHEISSLAFLPLFSKEKWPIFVEMIVAHHKSVKKDSSERGLLDIINRYRLEGLQEIHLKDWETWSPRALRILKSLSIEVRVFSLNEASAALEWVAEYCEKLDNGWSEWKGILMASDHMASALGEDLKPRIKHLFKKPEFDYKDDSNPLYPLSMKPTDDERSHTLVLAPTGAGKTDFLLKRCKGRIFYVLPFQASINAMYERIKKMLPKDTDVRLLHSSSKLVADDETRQEIQLQPFVGASVKVLTPHQISSIIFGSMTFEANLLDLRGCDIILDEVHTYQAESQAMVVEMVRVLLLHDCRIHIGTATMPTALYSTLLELMGGKSEVNQVKLTEEELNTYDRHVIHKHETFDELYETIESALEDKEKVLIVLNTVKNSQEIYEKLSAIFPEVPSMLIHSRFRRKDRRKLESRLKQEFDEKPGPCFVVSTQVVEVSLDINFDRMITKAAPLDSLIQRFGRVNRKRLKKDQRTLKPIHVIEPGENTLPYDKEIVEKSFKLLPDDERLPSTQVQQLIDQVYPEIAISKITGYCRWEEGELVLKKLRHISEPMLLKLLKINSVTCILANDYEAYMEAKWEERQWLEIPVNQKSFYGYDGNLQPAEAGSEPYIMDGQEKYETLGLQLKQSSNFI